MYEINNRGQLKPSNKTKVKTLGYMVVRETEKECVEWYLALLKNKVRNAEENLRVKQQKVLWALTEFKEHLDD